mgnify:FL=1
MFEEDDKPKVYVLTQEGQNVNVYNCYISALKAAIEHVTIEPDNTFVDSLEYLIYLEGDRGLVTITVEDLL